MGKREKTLKDFINENRVNNEEEIAKERVNAVEEKMDEFGVHDIIFDEHFQNKLEEYNQRFTELDELYTDLIPNNAIIVRVKAKKLREKDGTLLPNFDEIAVPTQNGIGYIDNIPNPYVFSKTAVIVALPEVLLNDSNQTYKVGDLVAIDHNERFYSMNVGGKYDLRVRNAFTHPEYEGNVIPYDPSSRHYGYLYVDTREIQAFIKKVNRD